MIIDSNIIPMSKITLIVAFTIIFSPTFSQQNHVTKGEISAYDAQAFYLFIQAQLKYPDEARKQELSAVVYIQFTTDETGKIIPASVKAIDNYCVSCCREAERVVKQFDGRFSWLGKDKRPFNVNYTLPIKFIFNDGELFPSHVIDFPIKAVVGKKNVETNNPAWTVFRRKGLEEKIGKIYPGSAVNIIGWSAWAYFIQTDSLSGFISYKSLKPNNELDSLNKIVIEKSDLEGYNENKIIAANKIDTIKNYNSKDAYLSLTANKKSIVKGECIIVNLAFNVSEKNQIPIQFFELTHQISSLVNNEFKVKIV